MEKIRVYHVDLSQEGSAIIKNYLANNKTIRLVGNSSSEMVALEEIGRIYPDIVIVDENIAPGHLHIFIEKLLLATPYIGIIVTTLEKGMQKAKQFMNVGARDYLVKPFTPSDLLESIHTVFGHLQRFKEYVIKNSAKLLTRTPQMITVFSTKGGVGKTTVSTLLASGLAALYKEETVIVDLDLQFGDVSLLLNLEPKMTITNLSEAAETVEPAELKKWLIKHKLGVHLLPSPFKPEEAEFITEAALKRIFSLLREEFDYIIVDCPPGFSDPVITALEHSDYIFFVTTQELISLKNARYGIDALKQIGIDSEKIRVIVNQFSKSNQISLDLISETLGQGVFATITNDYTSVIRFLNHGEPEIIYQTNGEVGKDMKKIIEGVRNYLKVVNTKSKRKWYWPFKKR